MNVKLTDGQVMEWDAFQESKSKPNIQPQASNVIQISARTIAIRIIECEHGKPVGGRGYFHWQFVTVNDGYV
jgi:hypothetical protein